MTPLEYDVSVSKRVAKRDGTLPDLAFPALGLCGEAAEVAAEVEEVSKVVWVPKYDGLISELGDVLWYVTALCQLTGLSFERLQHEYRITRAPSHYHASSEREAGVIMRLAGSVADRVKKAGWHGKPLTKAAVYTDLAFIVEAVRELAERCGHTLASVCAANDAKLEKRYPTGFVEGGGVR